MPISHTHKIIFIHIPKCAGTSISNLFDDMACLKNFYHGGHNDDTIKLIPQEKFTDIEYRECYMKSPQHYTLIELKKILGKKIFEEYKKISMVRNPYDRFFSEYKYTFSWHKLSFCDYVQYVKNLSKLERIYEFDGHLETQYSFVKNEDENLKDIETLYRYENLNNVVLDLFKLSNGKILPHKNKSKEMSHYLMHYTRESEEFVYTTYIQDFEKFNYERISL
jgi:hypothetical protein